MAAKTYDTKKRKIAASREPTSSSATITKRPASRAASDSSRRSTRSATLRGSRSQGAVQVPSTRPSANVVPATPPHQQPILVVDDRDLPAHERRGLVRGHDRGTSPPASLTPKHSSAVSTSSSDPTSSDSDEANDNEYEPPSKKQKHRVESLDKHVAKVTRRVNALISRDDAVQSDLAKINARFDEFQQRFDNCQNDISKILQSLNLSPGKARENQRQQSAGHDTPDSRSPDPHHRTPITRPPSDHIGNHPPPETIIRNFISWVDTTTISNIIDRRLEAPHLIKLVPSEARPKGQANAGLPTGVNFDFETMTASMTTESNVGFEKIFPDFTTLLQALTVYGGIRTLYLDESDWFPTAFALYLRQLSLWLKQGYSWSGILQYVIAHFRKHQPSPDATVWANTDIQIFATYMFRPQPAKDFESPSKKSDKGKKAKGKVSPSDICMNWNTAGKGCSWKQCVRRHVCDTCEGDHKSFSCVKSESKK